MGNMLFESSGGVVGYLLCSANGEVLTRSGRWIRLPENPFSEDLTIVEANRLDIVHHPNIRRELAETKQRHALMGRRKVTLIPVKIAASA